MGNGVRFGRAGDCLAAGEGIETVLSLKTVLPGMPMVAALSAAHLAGLILSPDLLRLYVARDNDAGGQRALERLTARGATSGIDVRALLPQAEDFNANLLELGVEHLRVRVAAQLAPEDARRFLMPAAVRIPR